MICSTLQALPTAKQAHAKSQTARAERDHRWKQAQEREAAEEWQHIEQTIDVACGAGDFSCRVPVDIDYIDQFKVRLERLGYSVQLGGECMAGIECVLIVLWEKP